MTPRTNEKLTEMLLRTAVVVTALFFLSSPVLIKGTKVLPEIFDVCATCHPNATCDEKTDGSGGFTCNCMYGFVGNGRTYCEDKDECQTSSYNICGRHTACHNTYGSFYCTCLSGYSPSNNMAIFIPNDGTYCHDIDECKVQGICGEGGRCRNKPGFFECECQIGYQVQNGSVPFHPRRDQAFCKAVECGPPPSAEHAVQISPTRNRYGSMINYRCKEGFLWRGGDNMSFCGLQGMWKGPSLICEAKCGAVPEVPYSEIVWQNDSMALHRCMNGYYNPGGNNRSVCGHNGQWNTTMHCKELDYGINDIHVFNEKCLRWKAGTNSGKKEDYKMVFIGVRDYQKIFRDERRRYFSSSAARPEVCLDLLPATNYTVNITTMSALTSTITTINTSIPAPPVPEVTYRDVESPLPTLWLRRSTCSLDPICLYEVFVMPVEGTLVFDCNSPRTPHFFNQGSCHGEYIAAQIQLKDVGKEMNFTIGDQQYYGQFYNAPLENGKDYSIVLRTVCQWGQISKRSCVIWAKARGTSQIMKISALLTCGSIGSIGCLLFVGYSYVRYFKRR
uniref:Uncharacterized protein n=1 Tax=Denticeps clupeoides TaxID=299321 RepID=A0AAY4CJM5_9TELE